MNAGKLIRASILVTLAAVTGCATAPQVEDHGAILSAADAQSMIRVSVTVLEPPVPEDAELIAAVAD